MVGLVTEMRVAKKSRNKPIKSCIFCRKRKLKCDQIRPSCSTCLGRGLNDCTYFESSHSSTFNAGDIAQSEEDQLSEKSSSPNQKPLLNLLAPNSVFIDKSVQFGSLKRHCCGKDHKLNQCDTPGGCILTTLQDEVQDDDCINPLNKVHFLQVKKEGRAFYCGPTSMKASGFLNTSFLHDFQTKLWSKVKDTRRKWKNTYEYTTLKELLLLENSGIELSSKLLDNLARELPTYEKTFEILENFFVDSELFYFSNMLDQKKVLKNFADEFLAGTYDATLGGRKIKGFQFPKKKNFFKLGVILMILSLCYYRNILPDSIELFTIYLSGLSSAKANYIERVQFLALRHLHTVRFKSTGGDYSHLLSGASLLCTSATSLGLHENIPLLYKNQEEIFGSCQSLINLWIWVLFIDWEVSFNVGQRCMINDENVSSYELQMLFKNSAVSKSYLGIMVKFLTIVRPMTSSVHSKKHKPNLVRYHQDLLDFIETEFGPVTHYIELKFSSIIDLKEMPVLCSALSTMITFLGLRFAAYQERTKELENQTIKACLISLSICVKLSIFCLEHDKMKYPKLTDKNCKVVPPFTGIAMSIMNILAARALLLFFRLVYFKYTLFSNGFTFITKGDEAELTITNLRANSDVSLSVNQSFDKFCEIFDAWDKCDDDVSNSIRRRSQIMVVLISLERLCRTILEKVKESRFTVETDWLNQKKPVTVFDNALLTKEINKQLENTKDLLSIETKSVENGTIQFSNNSTVDNEFIEYPGDTLGAQVSDDFWNKYVSIWEEFFSTDNINQLFVDLAQNE